MLSLVSRKCVLEHLLTLPAEEAVAVIVSEPGSWPSWVGSSNLPSPGIPGLSGAQRFAQRSHWVLQAAAKHENARSRLRRRLSPWLVAVFDLASEPGVKVVAPAQTLREILRHNKDLCVRLCEPGAVTSLRYPRRSLF